MSVKKVCLTEAGARISAYAMLNNIAVNFTKFVIGSGENYNPSQATAMTKEEFQVTVDSVQRKGGNYWKVRGAFRNDEIKSDLTFRELGLYVSDPENNNEDVLFCYGNAKSDDFDYTEIIPAFTTSGNVATRIIDIDVYVQGDNATYYIDDTAKVDIATVQELRDDLTQEIADREQADLDAIVESKEYAKDLFKGLETRKLYSENPNGYPTWFLIADITNFYSDNEDGKVKQGFTGYAIFSQENGVINENEVSRITACVSHQNVTDGNTSETISLKTDIPEIKPRIVKYNDKYYIAIENTGVAHYVTLFGVWTNCLKESDIIIINNTDKETLPNGMEVIARAGYNPYYGDVTTLKTLNTNGWTPETDTVENWASKYNTMWYFSQLGQINGQPSQYGILFNCNYGLQLHQLWLAQPTGAIYHRGGNGSTGFFEWKEIFDTSNIKAITDVIPTEASATNQLADKEYIKKVAGTNGWTTETDTISEWVKKGNCVWWFSEKNLNAQPSNYGLLVNFIASNTIDCHQLWLEQGNGSVYHRSGNVNTGFSGWKTMLDSSNTSTERPDFVHTCSTSSSTKAKTIDFIGFNLQVGSCVKVRFTNGNDVASPTLNVGGSGAKEIVIQDGRKLKYNKQGSYNEGAYGWQAGIILELMYDGTYWVATNNPIVQQQLLYTYGTTKDCVAYKVYLDGYKEMWGAFNVIDKNDNSGSNSPVNVTSTVTLPFYISHPNLQAHTTPYGDEKTSVTPCYKIACYYPSSTTIKFTISDVLVPYTETGMRLNWKLTGY